MDGHGSGCHDFFSQDESSRISPFSLHDDEYGSNPAAPYGSSQSHLGSYSSMLMSQPSPGEQEVFPAGRGGGRTTSGSFHPPRQSTMGAGYSSGGPIRPPPRQSRSLSFGAPPVGSVPTPGTGGGGRGTAGRGRGRAPRAPTPVEDEGDNMQSNTTHKANWTDQNIHIFCELAVERIRAGERTNGVMSVRGYKEMTKKYLERTGLRHDIKQLRNRWTNCKTMWTFLDQSFKDTGLGKNPDGTINADDDWWEKNTKKRVECKRFRYGLPTYLELLREMFQGYTVDGSTAYVPGQGLDEEEEENEEGVDLTTPTSSCSRKRGINTMDEALSPTKEQKKIRNPMVKAIKGLIDTIAAGQSQEATLLKEKEEKENEEYNLCLTLAESSGADQESDEYFKATTLFRDKFNRKSFLRFATDSLRMKYLRRFTQQ